MNANWRRHRVWDHVTIYLPVLLMGALAMGSYWIVKSAPAPEPEAPAKPVVHEPDYFMRGFSLRAYHSSGSLRSEVAGHELRHYPDNGTLEVDHPRILTLSADGSRTQASAHHLWTNAEQTEFELKSQARIERTAQGAGPSNRIRFESEHLRLDTNSRLIESHAPVLLERGRDRIAADGMLYSEKTGVAQFNGKVKATLGGTP